MKKSLLLTMVCAFTLCTGSLFAQEEEQVTIAYFGFEEFSQPPGSTGFSPTTHYLFWGTDEVYGTTRPWVLNELKDGKEDILFGAVYEGISGEEAILAFTSHTITTTSTIGAYCINNTGAWNRDDAVGKSERYWLMDNVSTVGIKDMVVTMYIAGVGTQGPTEFKFGYKIGDGDWVDGDFKAIRVGCSATAPLVETDLRTDIVPAACNNQEKVAFRWLTGEKMSNGEDVVAGTAVRADKIELKGTSTGSGIINPKTEAFVYAKGSQLIGDTDANVKVYTPAGAIVYDGAILKGGSIELSRGIYIVKAVTADKAKTVKVLIK